MTFVCKWYGPTWLLVLCSVILYYFIEIETKWERQLNIVYKTVWMRRREYIEVNDTSYIFSSPYVPIPSFNTWIMHSIRISGTEYFLVDFEHLVLGSDNMKRSAHHHHHILWLTFNLCTLLLPATAQVLDLFL